MAVKCTYYCYYRHFTFKRKSSDIGVIWHDESPVNKMTFEKLRSEVWYAYFLPLSIKGWLRMLLKNLHWKKGSAIAIDMSMNVKSVVIYLAIVFSGYVVVSIVDSFVASEISTRLVLSKAKAIFTQVRVQLGQDLQVVSQSYVEERRNWCLPYGLLSSWSFSFEMVNKGVCVRARVCVFFFDLIITKEDFDG
ncbi:hypothetical protein Hanom_Chr05g00391021 [Helianthus anomalus]